MSVKADLSSVSSLCKAAAKQALEELLALGARPEGAAEALVWDQMRTRLQGQINSLTALVSKLTAAAIIEGLEQFSGDMAVIGQVTVDATDRIRDIQSVSDFLSKAGAILDLGTAVLALATAPSSATVKALQKAGEAVRTSFGETGEDEAFA